MGTVSYFLLGASYFPEGEKLILVIIHTDIAPNRLLGAVRVSGSDSFFWGIAHNVRVFMTEISVPKLNKTASKYSNAAFLYGKTKISYQQ
jgi:hypothetical protein